MLLASHKLALLSLSPRVRRANNFRQITPRMSLGRDATSELAKAEVEEHGKVLKGGPAATAQAASNKSQSVVDQIVNDPPVSKEDAAAARSAEAKSSGTGQISKGSASAHLQSSAEQVAKVAEDKLATGEPINKDDAARIHSAEVQKTGGAIPGGLASQANSAAAKAEQAGIIRNA